MSQRTLSEKKIGFGLAYPPLTARWQEPIAHAPVKEDVRKPLMTAAYVGLLFFYFIYFFRPEDFIPGLAVLPLAKIAGGLTAVALLGAILSGQVRLNTEIKLLLALFIDFCLCIPGSLWPGGSYDVVINGFSKYVLAVIITFWVLSTLGRLRKLMLLQTFAMLTMALLALSQKPIANRMFGVGNMFADPNDFALNLCIILPFCVALLLSSRSLPRKLFWTAAVAITLLAIVSTYSRGGFLALVAVVFAMWRRFGGNFRSSLVLLILIGSLATASVLIVGKSSYVDRMSTIINPQADTSGSVESREALLKRGLEVTLQHPFFGVGPGQFEQASGLWHVTHNSYTQLTADAGIPALLIFFLLIRRTFKNLRMLRSEHKGTEAWYLAQALSCAMIAYLVGGFFLSTAYWLVPYLLIAYASALLKISKDAESASAAIRVAF
jgi:O-antigen ligase